MKIDPSKYSDDLLNKFSKEAVVFDSILEKFDSKDKINGGKVFMDFWNKYNNSDNDCSLLLCSCAYELYNNLSRFFERGVFGLFKEKQAEWEAPEVRISKEDVNSSDIDTLCNKQKIFRGLSKKEHEGKQYQQSWTLDSNIANRFAKETYSDEPKGIVVEATVDKGDIVYYDRNDHEKEVIIEYGCVNNKAVEFKT